MSSIICGNCKLTHDSVEQVRSCYAIQRQDPTSVTPSQACSRGESINESIERFYKENEPAQKLITNAAQKHGVRFMTDEERAAEAERIMGFRNGPSLRKTPSPRELIKAAIENDANSNRNAAGQTKVGLYKVGQNIFKVTPARTSNRTFAHILLSDEGQAPEWEYKGLGAKHIPADAPKLTLEDAKSFGHTHGYCIVCGRLLTAEDSVAAGIGPICAGKL